MEVTARRRVDRRRHLAREHELAAGGIGIGRERGRKQRLRVGVPRVLKRASVSAYSTIRPRYITAVRCAMYRTVARLWATSRYASFRCSCRSFSRFMICARIDTSSADLTGTSHTRTVRHESELCQEKPRTLVAFLPEATRCSHVVDVEQPRVNSCGSTAVSHRGAMRSTPRIGRRAPRPARWSVPSARAACARLQAVARQPPLHRVADRRQRAPGAGRRRNGGGGSARRGVPRAAEIEMCGRAVPGTPHGWYDLARRPKES